MIRYGLPIVLVAGAVLLVLSVLFPTQDYDDRRWLSGRNLKSIVLAFHDYVDNNEYRLPPAVVTDKNGRALYFSRSTIPFDRDKGGNISYFKHLGMYAYRKAALDRFCSLPESKLEAAERLEQLRLLENGIDIYVEETPFNTVEVDTEEDLRRVQEILK